MGKRRQSKKRGFFKGAIYANYDSYGQFAEVVGMSEQAISQIICGRRKLSKAEMARIAMALSTPKHLLFGDEAE